MISSTNSRGASCSTRKGVRPRPPCYLAKPLRTISNPWHSRNGFSRDRMSASRALEFDARVREIVRPYAQAGFLRHEVQVELAWGVPNIV